MIIREIKNDHLKARMYDMGLFPNQGIKVVTRAPFGDPLVVQIEGQLIMLRANEADLILVEEIATN